MTTAPPSSSSCQSKPKELDQSSSCFLPPFASPSFSPFQQQIRGPLPPLAQKAIKCIKMRFSLSTLQPGSNNKRAERDQLPVGEIGHKQQSAKNTACSSRAPETQLHQFHCLAQQVETKDIDSNHHNNLRVPIYIKYFLHKTQSTCPGVY